MATVPEWIQTIGAADAVVNLAGAGIADKRWSTARKHVLRQSRVDATRTLIKAIRSAERRPPVFVNGSAIGYYGATSDETMDESFPPGDDFLARLCVDSEAEAHAASALGSRLVIVRSGIVLAKDGGALAKLLTPFQFFVGGPIATGQQIMSWIHRDDWVALMAWAIETPSVSGILNATAPNPVSNADFSRALGRAVHRPSWLRMPALALGLLIGEMSDIALVGGQRVVPKRAMDLGFQFKYPDIDAAMASAVK
jgi:hypothetical protein